VAGAPVRGARERAGRTAEAPATPAAAAELIGGGGVVSVADTPPTEEVVMEVMESVSVDTEDVLEVVDTDTPPTEEEDDDPDEVVEDAPLWCLW
jgi:hypothetical protein